MNNVKRIEVFSGAASSLYGSDAIAGVINIITDDGKEQLSASSSTKVLNNGRFAQHIDVDATAGKFSSRTSYTHQQADNWQVNPYQTFREGAQEVQKLTGRPMSTGFRSENISEQFDWNFSQQWSAYLRGDFYDNITQRPRAPHTSRRRLRPMPLQAVRPIPTARVRLTPTTCITARTR